MVAISRAAPQKQYNSVQVPQEKDTSQVKILKQINKVNPDGKSITFLFNIHLNCDGLD